MIDFVPVSFQPVYELFSLQTETTKLKKEQGHMKHSTRKRNLCKINSYFIIEMVPCRAHPQKYLYSVLP